MCVCVWVNSDAGLNVATYLNAISNQEFEVVSIELLKLGSSAKYTEETHHVAKAKKPLSFLSITSTKLFLDIISRCC